HAITLVDSENVSPHIDCYQTWSTASSITFEQNKCILDHVISGDHIQVAMIEDIYGPVSNLVFKNNVFIGQYRGINSVSTGSGISGLTVENNTFKNMAEEGVQLTNTTNSKVQNNIFYDVGKTGTSYLCVDAASRSS